jgi:hypothetical protein
MDSAIRLAWSGSVESLRTSPTNIGYVLPGFIDGRLEPGNIWDAFPETSRVKYFV